MEKIMACVVGFVFILFLIVSLKNNYKKNRNYSIIQDEFDVRLQHIQSSIKNTFDKEAIIKAYDLIQFELNNPDYDLLSEDNKNRLHFELRDLGGRLEIIKYYNGENNLNK